MQDRQDSSLDFSYFDTLLGEELTEAGEEYRHVWVVAEAAGGALTAATLEVMGQGRDIADQFGVYLHAILLGSGLQGGVAQALIRYGADGVLLVDDPGLASYQVEIYAGALADLVTQRRPEIVLLSASALGDDLAPRLAQRLNTGLISHCVQISLDTAERLLVGACPALGGRYFHAAVCPEARPQMATLEPGAFQPAYEDPYRSGDVERVSVTLADGAGRLIWVDVDATGQADAANPPLPLAKARVIVSAGRGLRDEEGFALAQQLAAALNGHMAGSRGAVDEAWIDETQLVGMSGQTVRPDLYIACGISGAIQHYLGMQDASFVVAINRDEKAPIMKVAHIGVVGDAKAVIAALLQELALMRQN